MLVGENGTGKSTLLEALAGALGFPPEGGPLPYAPQCRTRRIDASDLATMIEVDLGARKPRTAFFLRAESFFNVARSLDAHDLAEIYGGRDLLGQSHGESFLALAANRFGRDGLFLLDEPEAALSVTSQLGLIDVMRRATGDGAQFVIATHSPVLMAFPNAVIYETSGIGITRISSGEAEAVRLTRSFLEAPDRFLRHLFDAEDTSAD